MSIRNVLFVLILSAAVAGCLTPAREQAIGDDQSQKVAESMGLVTDEVPLRYVRAIGERLAAVSDRPEGPWSFQIVDAPDANAFALPGGYIYVTRGLLALVNSEDELAGVIGHEIGHVTARHSSKRLGTAVLTAPVTLASGIAGLAAGIVSPLLGNVIRGTGQLLTGGLVIAPYSRAQENEADQIGQTLSARSGYAPDGISRFMQTLDREVKLLSEDERRFHFLDSHPQAADRAVKTAARAQTLEVTPAAPIAGDTAAVFAKLDGLLVGDDPAQGVFREHRFLHPGFDLAMEFPEGWETRNTPEAAGALSPEKDAAVAIRFVAADTTLDAVLAEAAETQKGLEFTRGTIRGLPSARTRHSGGGMTADITLVGYRKDVFAVVGQSAAAKAGQFEAAFGETASSFRALKASERSSIRESRLRVRSARKGETPNAIVERTGSTWSAARLAVANGVGETEILQAGRPVKVALPEPYSR